MVLSKVQAPLHLLEQPSLDFLPGVPPALVCVHAEEDAQATRQAARLLLQQVGLRLAFEALNANIQANRWSDLQGYLFKVL